MSIWNTLRRAQKTVYAQVEAVLGHEPDIDPSALQKEILDQLASRAVPDQDGRSIPFGRAIVRLQPKTARQHAEFEEAFLREEALERYIERGLKDAHIRCPVEFQVCVELLGASKPEGSSPWPEFAIDYVRLQAVRLEEIPEIHFSVIRGAAEQQVYDFKKDRILIGRPTEVLDREGRIVRKNDIVFLEGEDEVGVSVGSAHARVWYDYDKHEFRIMDEESRYGTSILRGGSVIEVPAEDPAGVSLQSGDEVFFGQAGLRLKLS